MENLIELKQRVFEANLALPAADLIKLTWGNVSVIDRKQNLVIIKPSGVPYPDMTAEMMVVTNLQGEVLDGEYNPSSDLPTHLVLYKAFPEIGAVVHTHSKFATAWAQAGRDIPPFGTTHADTFYGAVPCARELTSEEINGAYEVETGNVIVETFRERNIDPMSVPGIIINGHGPFTWGKNEKQAVENSIILDEVAEMALHTEAIAPNRAAISQYLLDKHYKRKHGPNAYYGQR